MAAAGVSLLELRSLFAGVRAGEDSEEWSTAPSYSLMLAAEIARRTDSQTPDVLRVLIYGADFPADELPLEALDAIKWGVERYRSTRQINAGGRGL
jgi:hypothetical protein